MPAAGQLAQVADRLGSLGSLAENHFAATGRSLEAAVGILAELTGTFQVLLGELRGGELARSGQDLTSVATGIGTLAGRAHADVSALQVLTMVADTIDERIARMHDILREVDILAINARLLAATMGDAGVGFLPFAAEIRRSAGAACDGLQRVAQELTGVRQHLHAAGLATAEFVARHAGTMQSITARLAASVASIDTHVRLSGDTASVVSARADAIHGQVAAAIVALQLGDITRQRIEHMQSACRLLAQESAAPAVACRLVAAQLLDITEELAHGAGCIVDELHGLVLDAGDIARQGHAAYGAATGTSGSFLGELATDTEQARALFGHLRAARHAVNMRVGAVVQAARGLLSHVSTIRSVDADIHIMGINTSLRCSRLGVAGRPLSVIAQAVRACGRQTAQHAGAVLDALHEVVSKASSLAAVDVADRGDGVDAATQRLAEAVRHLGDTGERMRQALAALAGDGEAVAQLLHKAVAGFAGLREVEGVLREAAAECSRNVAANDGKSDDTLLDRIAATYTMARERAVHSRFDPRDRAAPIAAAAPAATDVELADVLF